MTLQSLFFGLVALFVAGCGHSSRRGVDLEVVNRSTRLLQNVQANFGTSVCDWGVVGNNATKGYMAYTGSIGSGAELKWEVDGRLVAKNVSLVGRYRPGVTERLTFLIYDDRVEVASEPAR